MIADHQQFFSKFNNFLINAGENFAKKFDNVDKNSYKQFFQNKVKSSEYLIPSGVDEVIDLINSLN